MQLYNTLSAKEREALIEQAGEERLTLSFYKYAHIGNPELFRNHLFVAWDAMDVLGRIYVAHEGINAQLSIPAKQFTEFKTFIDEIYFLKNVRLNIAIEQDNKSFLKLKIKVRPKILADGLNDKTFDVTNKGKHVNAEEFNQLIEDPNTVLVDMRNHYESEIGHFKNAITPDVDTFRDSLDIIEKDLKDYKDNKKLVMYCTGGIRCEKASAYYKHKGFKQVYQLEGGIIEYARQVKAQGLDNKFLGKNFVFDHRRSEQISNKIIARCHQCGEPCDTHVNCANEACHLLFIQCEACAQKMDNCCSENCQNVIKLPYEEQKRLRAGKKNSNKIFKKGRSPVLKFKA
ncbi:rhodanese-related sulfurtransferase [Flavobacterium sp. CS20]|uniref:oxygen-dependent tRNA uridine(34) hydroxylase TrhO n=1 Tax=Flavobacterium sp. CS20 TaxID=2775246 RepID=UPI001B3A2024|nr:rhodanese-related sulfurtransferase [Flavobacterium sp. CS20]QTY26154.1 rhodanese-related sulfurtransferase [Flavobacterium sp. CS20]